MIRWPPAVPSKQAAVDLYAHRAQRLEIADAIMPAAATTRPRGARSWRR